jgi:hypothetical protein
MGFNVLGNQLKSMANPSAAVTLQSGQFAVLPAGQYMVALGKYSVMQYYDPVSTTWRNFNNAYNGNPFPFVSDGFNYRIINLSGCVVGAVVTTGGTSNTAKNGFWAAGSSSTAGVTAIVAAPANAPTLTAQMNVIVGGAVSATVAVTAGGAGYVYPPILQFSAPAQGGVRATGYAVMTAGAVSSVVVTNQGAGYTTAPTINAVSLAGDTGTGAVLTPVLVTSASGGLGQACVITMSSYGGGYATVPAITMAGLTSVAATAVCCLSVVTGPTTAATAHLNNTAYPHQTICPAQKTAATLFGSMTNPDYSTNLFTMRNAVMAANVTAAGSAETVLDGGMSQLDVANLVAIIGSSDGTVAGATTASGGASGGAVTDISWVIPL